MPSFQDSAVIFFIALLLFGPKKLPELARYIGKLMHEFRRASSEFRMQMDDEFRQIEQVEQQKKIAAMEAAAPLAPAITADIPDPEHPHMPTVESLESAIEREPESFEAGDLVLPATAPEPAVELASAQAPLPIASSGDLRLMPPATGLPTPRVPRALDGLFDSIPHAPDPAIVAAEAEPAAHG